MVSPTLDRRFGVSGNLGIKAPAFVATTANITLSGEQTIDGMATAGSRVLVKNQTSSVQNGLYDSSTGTWTRCLDANGNRDLVEGTSVYVTDGNSNAGTMWVLTASNPITIDTTALTWARPPTSPITTLDFLQAGAGAGTRAAQDKMRDWVAVLDFTGVDPTGVADSTTGLQAAITYARSQGGDSRSLFWRKGTYKVTGQLTLGSTQHIIFEPGVVVDATGLPNETTSLFAISNQTGVTLEGNGATLNGARAAANPAVEGTSAAFFVYGSDNVLIRDFNISGFATDGITLTGDNAGSGACTNVRIEGCDCYNNRRNGLSIIHARGAVITGGRYRNSNGAPSGPWAGIDVEPNANEFAQDVLIQGVRTQSNDGPGYLFVPGAMAGAVGTEYEVSMIGCRSEEDGAVTGTPALRFANGGALTNQIFGQIVVRDTVIVAPKSMGVGFTNWDADKAPRVVLDNVMVINPDGTSAASTNERRTGFVVYTETAQAVTYNGNIVLRNCRASDMRASPRMVYPMLLQSDAAKGVRNVVVIDPVGENFTASTKADVITNTSGSSLLDQCGVVYSTPRPVNLTTTQAVDLFGGKRVVFNANTVTLTLPPALNCPGMEYQFVVAAGVTGATIARSSTDTFKFNGAGAVTSITPAAGDVVRLRSLGGTLWAGSYGA